MTAGRSEEGLLTGNRGSKLDRVVQQSLPELVPADAGRPHQDEGPLLVRLRVVQRHLLVRRNIRAASLEGRVLSLPLVSFPRTEQRGGAGLPTEILRSRVGLAPDRRWAHFTFLHLFYILHLLTSWGTFVAALLPLGASSVTGGSSCAAAEPS